MNLYHLFLVFGHCAPPHDTPRHATTRHLSLYLPREMGVRLTDAPVAKLETDRTEGRCPASLIYPDGTLALPATQRHPRHPPPSAPSAPGPLRPRSRPAPAPQEVNRSPGPGGPGGRRGSARSPRVPSPRSSGDPHAPRALLWRPDSW